MAFRHSMVPNMTPGSRLAVMMVVRILGAHPRAKKNGGKAHSSARVLATKQVS